MILSYQHQFVFIKTAKTAGTSIEVFLSQHCGPQDVVTPFGRPEPGHQPRNHIGFRNHLSAAAVRDRVGAEIWANYRTFCVERNPWDKVISHYHFVNQRFEQGRLSWEAYLARGRFPHNLGLYSERAADGQRCILVDQVLHYERLNEELAPLLRGIGIPFSGRLEPRAKGQYRVSRKPRFAYYTPAQREQVAVAFAEEISLHGYSFDDVGVGHGS